MAYLIPKEATLDYTPIEELTNVFHNLLTMTNGHEVAARCEIRS
jgi:hypothetical protein